MIGGDLEGKAAVIYQACQDYGETFAITFIAEALRAVRREALEEAIETAEKFKFNGDYKDCPAAWITACYDKYARAIRELIDKESPK